MGFFSLYEGFSLEHCYPLFEKVHTGSKNLAILIPKLQHKDALAPVEAVLNKYDVSIEYFEPNSFQKYLLNKGKLKLIDASEELLLIQSIASIFNSENSLAQAYPEYFADLLKYIFNTSSLNQGIQKLKHAYYKLLKDKNWETIQTVLSSPTFNTKTYTIENLLIYGFSGLDIKEICTLYLAGAVSKNTSCFLTPLPLKSQEILISSLEEYFKTSILFLNHQENLTIQDCPLLISDEDTQQAQIIIQKIEEYLFQAPKNSTLGVVFLNGKSHLSLQVATSLNQKKIGFQDNLQLGFSYSTAQISIKAWLEYQKQASVETLINFLNHLHTYFNDTQAPNFNLTGALKKIAQAAQSALTSKATVVLNFLDKNSDFFKYCTLLPDTQTFSIFYQSTLDYIQSNDLQGWANFFTKEQESIIYSLEIPILRSIFIKYLNNTLTLKTVTPLSLYSEKSHIYLTDLISSINYQWDKLIICGLNESIDLDKNPYINSEFTYTLNKNNIKQGSQGIGHYILKFGSAYYLSPTEIQEAYLYYLKTHIYSKNTILLTASKQINCDTFLNFIFNTLNTSQEEAEMNAQRYIEPKNSSQIQEPLSLSIKNHLQSVYLSRQNPKEGFNAYSFCLNPDPHFDFQLPCKAWEEVFERPTSVFFKYLLKADPWPKSENILNAAILKGTWIHNWLCINESEKSLEKPKIEMFIDLVQRKAKQDIEKLKSAYGENLPLFLFETWHNSLNTALELAHNYYCTDFDNIISEWPLPNDIQTQLPNGYSLKLNGRIDAILSKNPIDLAENTKNDSELWILDFKTGVKAPLSSKRLENKLDGLQLALYGLVLEQLGYKNIHLSIVSPKSSLSSQVHIQDLYTLPKLFEKIQQIHTKGFFGIKGPMYGPYSKTKYPIATISIEESILETKNNYHY